MSDTLYVPPAPPVKRKRHIGLWVIGGLVVLGALSNLLSGSSARNAVSSPTAVSVAPVAPTGYVASNGYALNSRTVAIADMTWSKEAASTQETICTLKGEDPNSGLFQAAVGGFVKGSGYSWAESQAIVEYVIATYC